MFTVVRRAYGGCPLKATSPLNRSCQLIHYHERYRLTFKECGLLEKALSVMSSDLIQLCTGSIIIFLCDYDSSSN